MNAMKMTGSMKTLFAISVLVGVNQPRLAEGGCPRRS